MDFHEACESFIQYHCRVRSGARLQRLTSGLGHAEKVFLKNAWWPMFHQFQFLHPEYEIRDYKEGNRYIDFAYIESYLRVGIEIDGMGPHWRDISKWQFSEHYQRQNALIIDGWYVLRFTYDDVSEHPRLCQQTIQQLFGRWQSANSSISALSPDEREIFRLAVRSTDPITPQNICTLLHVCPKQARRILRTLSDKNWLEPASGRIHYTSYRLHPSKAGIRW